MAKMTKSRQENVRVKEDMLDNVLFECLEVTKMPEKWAFDKDNNIITVYPHPIIKRETKKVEGIKYLPYKRLI